MALRTFANRHITRTTTQVAFGCGAVTVAKADLNTVADFIDANPKAAASLPGAATQIGNYGSTFAQDLTLINMSGLKAFTKVVALPGGTEALRSFKRLVTASGTYYLPSQIAKIPAATLRDIAGARKPRVTKKVK